jgi:hypothetical protein
MIHLLTLYYFFFVLLFMVCGPFIFSFLGDFFFPFRIFFSLPSRLFERRSGLVRVCCRGRGRDCITQVRRCLTGRLPTLTNSLYLHRLAVSKETVREVMQKKYTVT